ncbi:MAG: pyridoxamine 5'-phosphate oxidase family protein [Chloroflexota bacterium]
MVSLQFDRILAPFRRPIAARNAARNAAPAREDVPGDAPTPLHCDDTCEKRLRTEPVVWLSTIDAQGFPHIVPVWFVWDGEAFVVFSKPHARKVQAIRRQARVALALGEPCDDFDVQLIEGHATVLPATTAQLLRDAAIGREHARKYAAQLFALGIDAAEYAATYSAVVRVEPTRFLPWRGRGPRWTDAPGRSRTTVRTRTTAPSASSAMRPATIAG